MQPYDLIYLGITSATGAAAVFLLVAHGWPAARGTVERQEGRLDRLLNQQLLLGVPPRAALAVIGAVVLMAGAIVGLIGGSVVWFVVGAAGALALPYALVGHLEQKRRERLEAQIVDGTTTLASAVRAGLNLVQAMQLLARNATGPIRQEFEQLLREYELGVDLNRAMHNASNRIGSSYYRLLFTAVQAHRERGGDMGQSLDRIADSIREIQRLEGRLRALTAQGRSQARFMGLMAFAIIGILWLISPEDTARLLTEPTGRVVLMVSLALIIVGWLWIRRIMQVDI